VDVSRSAERPWPSSPRESLPVLKSPSVAASADARITDVDDLAKTPNSSNFVFGGISPSVGTTKSRHCYSPGSLEASYAALGEAGKILASSSIASSSAPLSIAGRGSGRGSVRQLFAAGDFSVEGTQGSVPGSSHAIAGTPPSRTLVASASASPAQIAAEARLLSCKEDAVTREKLLQQSEQRAEALVAELAQARDGEAELKRRCDALQQECAGLRTNVAQLESRLTETQVERDVSRSQLLKAVERSNSHTISSHAHEVSAASTSETRTSASTSMTQSHCLFPADSSSDHKIFASGCRPSSVSVSAGAMPPERPELLQTAGLDSTLNLACVVGSLPSEATSNSEPIPRLSLATSDGRGSRSVASDLGSTTMGIRRSSIQADSAVAAAAALASDAFEQAAEGAELTDKHDGAAVAARKIGSRSPQSTFPRALLTTLVPQDSNPPLVIEGAIRAGEQRSFRKGGNTEVVLAPSPVRSSFHSHASASPRPSLAIDAVEDFLSQRTRAECLVEQSLPIAPPLPFSGEVARSRRSTESSVNEAASVISHRDLVNNTRSMGFSGAAPAEALSPHLARDLGASNSLNRDSMTQSHFLFPGDFSSGHKSFASGCRPSSVSDSAGAMPLGRPDLPQTAGLDSTLNLAYSVGSLPIEATSNSEPIPRLSLATSDGRGSRSVASDLGSTPMRTRRSSTQAESAVAAAAALASDAFEQAAEGAELTDKHDRAGVSARKIGLRSPRSTFPMALVTTLIPQDSKPPLVIEGAIRAGEQRSPGKLGNAEVLLAASPVRSSLHSHASVSPRPSLAIDAAEDFPSQRTRAECLAKQSLPIAPPLPFSGEVTRSRTATEFSVNEAASSSSHRDLVDYSRSMGFSGAAFTEAVSPHLARDLGASKSLNRDSGGSGGDNGHLDTSTIGSRYARPDESGILSETSAVLDRCDLSTRDHARGGSPRHCAINALTTSVLRNPDVVRHDKERINAYGICGGTDVGRSDMRTVRGRQDDEHLQSHVSSYSSSHAALPASAVPSSFSFRPNAYDAVQTPSAVVSSFPRDEMVVGTCSTANASGRKSPCIDGVEGDANSIPAHKGSRYSMLRICENLPRMRPHDSARFSVGST